MKSVNLVTCTFIPAKRIAITDVLLPASHFLISVCVALLSPFLALSHAAAVKSTGSRNSPLGLGSILANRAVLTRVPNPLTLCAPVRKGMTST